MEHDWIEEIGSCLPHTPGGKQIWSDGAEILCRSQEGAEAIANLLEALYFNGQNANVNVFTGYYDPEEDARNDQIDKYTGWYYIAVY